MTKSRCCVKAHRLQQGLTLVELLVAMAISAVIALAAISALIVSRQGFTTVDAASQLRDNGRFATDLIQRLGVQTGFVEIDTAATVRPADLTANPVSKVFGFNNSIASSTDPLNSATARTGATSLGFGSDILILRYQTTAAFRGALTSDRSMIDCFGRSQTVLPTDRDDFRANILHIAVDNNGEPALMCSTDTNFTSQPVVRGVENFQVLYGVDGVAAGTAVTATATSLATNYLRADQMAVSPDPTGALTNANWRRVRSIRIGMVIRGATGSAQQSAARTYYPLGTALSASGGTPGSAMSSTNDAGTIFTPAADSRLRQVVTLTIHLRNDSGL